MALNTGNRTSNASKNIIVSIINKVTVLLLTFISRKFFIQYIGVEYLGINGLFANILTLLAMADLGVGTALNVSLYKPIAENDTKRIAALLGFFKTMYYFIALGVTVIGLGLLPFLKYIVNMDRDIPHLYLYYICFVLKNTVSYMYVYKAAIINADQKNYVVNRIDFLVNIGRTIIQMVDIVFLRSFLVYLLIDIASVLTHNIIVSYIANKNYAFINEKHLLPSKEKKQIFSDVYSVFLYKVSWSLLNGTDNILMSIIVGTIYVGMYSNYYTITSNVETFVALMFTSLTASVGNLVATSSPETRYKTFKSMQLVSFWMCAIISICLLFLMQDFIQLWLGAEFLLDNATLIAIVLNVFFSICMRPVWTFREGTGMYRQIRYIMFATALLNLILSIILGKFMGISGIIFATVISKLATYFWYEPNILFKKFFHKKPSKYYGEHLKNALLMILCGIICFFLTSHFEQVSIFVWILKACICFLIVNIVYYLRYRKAPEFENIRDKVCFLLKMLKRGEK